MGCGSPEYPGVYALLLVPMTGFVQNAFWAIKDVSKLNYSLGRQTWGEGDQFGSSSHLERLYNFKIRATSSWQFETFGLYKKELEKVKWFELKKFVEYKRRKIISKYYGPEHFF